MAGIKVPERRSWLANAVYEIRLAGFEKRIKFSHDLIINQRTLSDCEAIGPAIFALSIPYMSKSSQAGE